MPPTIIKLFNFIWVFLAQKFIYSEQCSSYFFRKLIKILQCCRVQIKEFNGYASLHNFTAMKQKKVYSFNAWEFLFNLATKYILAAQKNALSPFLFLRKKQSWMMATSVWDFSLWRSHSDRRHCHCHWRQAKEKWRHLAPSKTSLQK